MRALHLLAIAAMATSLTAPALAGQTYTVSKGQTQGPLSIGSPYSRVVNNGTITNNGANGVPAITITNGASFTNNGTVTAKSVSGSSAKAVGVSNK